MCVATSGGLLAPFLIKFVPPPLAENLRYSTQCRTMPIGYPYEPLQNRTISRIFRRYKEGKKVGFACELVLFSRGALVVTCGVCPSSCLEQR